MKRINIAVSTVLSTIILSSVLLVIVGIASFAANNVINAEIENVQFEQAKNVLVSLANVVKKVMFTPHSSGYVRSSFGKTLPQFMETEKNLIVTITDDGKTWTHQVPANKIMIKGGSLVGVLTTRNILGDDLLLFTNASGSLVLVKVFQSDGAWVSLDYSRARCAYVGVSNYYNGTHWIEGGLNLIEITLVNMTFGVFEPGAQTFITVQNLGLYSPPPIQVSNNAEINVSLSEGPSASCTLADLVSDKGGDPEKPAIINVVIVNIEVSMLKGG